MSREAYVDTAVRCEREARTVAVVVGVLRTAIVERLNANQEIRKRTESGTGWRLSDARPKEVVHCRGPVSHAARRTEYADVSAAANPSVGEEVDSAPDACRRGTGRVAADVRATSIEIPGRGYRFLS